MKKLVITGLISTLSALLIVGCTGTPKSHDSNNMSGDMKTAEYTPIENELTLKQIHKKIVAAGKANGWKITEFKTNTLLAEKFSDEGAVSTTIHFSKDFFHLDPKNSELNAIIEKSFNEKSEH